MRRDNLEGLRAGLCTREGKTAIDDFSVGDNLPVPVASRTVPGDPIRKRVFRNHDAKSSGRAIGLSVTEANAAAEIGCPVLGQAIFSAPIRTSDGGQSSCRIVNKCWLGVCPVPGIRRWGLWDRSTRHTLNPGLHSRRYSARLSAHAVVSAPPKGRRSRACANPTHRKEPHSAAAFG